MSRRQEESGFLEEESHRCFCLSRFFSKWRVTDPASLPNWSSAIFNTYLPNSSYLFSSSSRSREEHGELAKEASEGQNHKWHIPFLPPMTRTRAYGFINNWQGDWNMVPKKVWVGDQWLRQGAQLKMRPLLPRKKGGWSLGSREQFLSLHARVGPKTPVALKG